jgi:hypothetical protein
MYQIHLGKLGAAGDINEFPMRVLAPPPTTVQQTPPPTPQQTCQFLLQSWKAANPNFAACLTQADAAQLIEICEYGLANNQVPKATSMIHNYVNAACAKRQPPTVTSPPATPPFTVPGPTQNPPITAPPRQDFPGGPPADQTSAPPTRDTSTQPEKSLLRQVGPIVGIGLLAAVGLTYARKRSLTKRKRRK